MISRGRDSFTLQEVELLTNYDFSSKYKRIFCRDDRNPFLIPYYIEQFTRVDEQLRIHHFDHYTYWHSFIIF